jgi:hypothetical protein|tara:strand:- start:1751 stop:1981 length:231 start_codon:yes stop_codon:yes gene_type:complete
MSKEEEKKAWVKLADLTQQIVSSLEAHDLIMEEKDKEALEGMNASMLFFMDQRNYKRAIEEGSNLLRKLEEIDKRS